MNIALTNFHQGWGGQALQVLLLARGLSGQGHKVTVCAPRGSDLAQRSAQAGLATFTGSAFQRGLRPIAFWRDLAAFTRMVRDHGVNIVHAHGSQDTWLAAIARRVTGLGFALVRTKHNSYPIAGHCCNRWLYGKAIDRLITVAETIRKAVISSGLIPEEKTHTIHAGLANEFGRDVPENAAAAVREEFGIPPASPVVGLVGRLAPDKGQEVLLRALVEVRKVIPDCHALLIGTGGDYDRQLALREQFGLTEHAHYTLFRKDIARLTKAFSVAVLAATDCDASSTVVKEAMCLGIPVVATDVGGTSEILDQGRCGTIVPPSDQQALAEGLLSVLRPLDQTMLQSRIDEARRRVLEHYTMAAITRATERVYQELQ